MSGRNETKAGANVTPNDALFVRFFLLRTVAWWRAVAASAIGGTQMKLRRAGKRYPWPCVCSEAETIQATLPATTETTKRPSAREN